MVIKIILKHGNYSNKMKYNIYIHSQVSKALTIFG